MAQPAKIGFSQINNSFSGANYLPYSVGLLQAFVEENHPDPDRFLFLEPLFNRIPVSQATRQFADADIAGFSLYVWNERVSLEICRRLKEHNPSVLIICGGPQVPDHAERFLRANPSIDIAVHGEGERVFLEILKAFPANRWEGIPGVSFLSPSGDFITFPKADRIKDLSVIPSPYLKGQFDQLMESYPDQEWLALWETNRGCPFQCTFCDWGSAIADKLFQFDMERIRAELDWFSEKRIEFIFNCDANFGILSRDVEIAEYAALQKERSGYPQALSVQNTKNATERAYLTQKILADAGLNKGVTLSMQSIYEPALENIKRQNISLDTYEELQRRFIRDGVITYSDMILGLPGETYDSFADGVSALIANGQHNRIQFNNLSVLPNAEMGDPEYQQKYGMQLVESKILNVHGFRELSEDGIEEVQQLSIATRSMPRDQWQKTRAFAWMAGLLHFDKLIQIPSVILHELTGISYRKICESFMEVDVSEFSLIAGIRDHFLRRAAEIQNGGPEYQYSSDWLGIWWPDDEYIFIRLSAEGELDSFYREVRGVLGGLLGEKGGTENKKILEEAITINHALLKQPGLAGDIEVELGYNILDVYHDVIWGKPASLKQVPSNYKIQRSLKVWSDWPSWCREVVWYGNKKGDYLYGSQNVEKYYAGHY